jgi:hypothetical protein
MNRTYGWRSWRDPLLESLGVRIDDDATALFITTE